MVAAKISACFATAAILILGLHACEAMRALSVSRCSSLPSRCAPVMAPGDVLDPRVRLGIVNSVFEQLDWDASGDVTRADLYAYTKGASKSFAQFARSVWAELDADQDGRLTRAELTRAPDVDLVLLGDKQLYEAFHAIDLNRRGCLKPEDIDAFVNHARLPSEMRQPVSRVFDRIPRSTTGVVTAVQLMILEDEELHTLRDAGREVRRTGYVPPEQSETAYDDEWDRRVILESRKNAGGMNLRQADILNQAIGFNT